MKRLFRIGSNELKSKHFKFNNYQNWLLYKYLRNLNPNPFGCYFNLDNNLAILSF